jgi:hypothetical protein
MSAAEPPKTAQLQSAPAGSAAALAASVAARMSAASEAEARRARRRAIEPSAVGPTHRTLAMAAEAGQ